MPRAYTVATAALALGVSTKWVDNVLSHNTITGVAQARQGVSRRLNIEGLLSLYLVLLLTNELGITLTVAIRLAEELATREGRSVTPAGVNIHLDLESHRNRLLSRLEHAVEVAPLPRRGRPPKNTTGRLD
jgi:hypothetical protein